MSTPRTLKLSKESKQMIEEISAISGIQRDVVREVWEFTCIRWIEQLTRTPEKLNSLVVPFLGSVAVKYKGDSLATSGELETQADAFISLSKTFLTMLGDVYDEKDTLITSLLNKKINNNIFSISDK